MSLWKSANTAWTDIYGLREKIPLFGNWGRAPARGARRNWAAEVFIRLAGRDPTARRTPQEPLLEEEGLVDILDGVARFAQRCSDGVYPDGPAVVVLDDHEEEPPIHLVEPGVVDLEPLRRGLGDGGGDRSLAEDLGEIAGAAEDSVGHARRPPRSGGDLARAARVDGHIEQPRASEHDLLEVLDRVEIEPDHIAEARQQRRCEEPGPRRRAHQGEGLERELDGRRVGAVAGHDVDLERLDRGVEALLDGGGEPVDLVDEQDIVRLELGEEPSEGALVLDRRPARRVQGDAHLLREDVGQRRLPKAGRAAKEDMVERLAPAPSGLDED